MSGDVEVFLPRVQPGFGEEGQEQAGGVHLEVDPVRAIDVEQLHRAFREADEGLHAGAVVGPVAMPRHAQHERDERGFERGPDVERLSRRSIQRAAWPIIPGAGTGPDSAGQTQPAFTSHASRPEPRRSMTVTCAPSRASR